MNFGYLSQYYKFYVFSLWSLLGECILLKLTFICSPPADSIYLQFWNVVVQSPPIFSLCWRSPFSISGCFSLFEVLGPYFDP